MTTTTTYRAGSLLTTPRTDLEMVNSGAWAKIGRKHYRHHSGIEITYNHNTYVWQISNGGAYSTLAVARHVAEKQAAAR